jgi:hypothetical protein
MPLDIGKIYTAARGESERHIHLVFDTKCITERRYFSPRAALRIDPCIPLAVGDIWPIDCRSLAGFPIPFLGFWVDSPPLFNRVRYDPAFSFAVWILHQLVRWEKKGGAQRNQPNYGSHIKINTLVGGLGPYPSIKCMAYLLY